MNINKIKSKNIYKTISSNLSSTNTLNCLTQFGRFIKDIECSIGKKLLHDAIIMEGFVDITNGNNVIHGKNSIVDQGLTFIANWVGLDRMITGSGGMASYGWSSLTTYMVIGSDTLAVTTHSTTALTSPIGTPPGTKPNTQSGATSNPAAGQWQVQWTSTWNAGTVSGTLGEIGLYLYGPNPLKPFGTDGASAVGVYFFSRMAAADTKFTPFTITTTVPLSIAWTFRLTYAT